MAEREAANGRVEPEGGAKARGAVPKKPPPLIRRRPHAGRIVGALIAVAFALVAAPIILADVALFDAGSVEAGEPSPITVRVPHFAGFRDPATGTVVSEGPIVVARGETPSASRARLASAVRERQPEGWPAWLVYSTGLLLVGLLFTGTMRRSHRGQLLRTHLVNVLLLLGLAVAIKLALLLSPMSVLAVPIGGLAIVALLAVDLSVGISTALVASLLVGMLVPFDPGVITVLAIQGIAPVLILGQDRKSKFEVLLAGAFGGLAAAVAYSLFFFLAYGEPPLQELADPAHSAWLAAGLGGLLSSVVAIFALPLYTWILGDITRNRLVELEDLSNPLLKHIAERSPGTWQHSLAMANMAEIAANEIGANGRLVRVGAYYHDLGKSLQPKYYIENLTSGELSPHDNLPPEVSADAIFAHVTEGVRMARKQGLPERIIDFMHMHHGDGLLEYFWSKSQEQGEAERFTEEDFRYPGVKPQSKETAILAICDAVEAASRTLRNPNEQAIQNLVQRIVYGKLHLGQLDESSLTVSDLRRISNSLRETIKHAHHGRIEYPWQRKEREEAAAQAAAAAPRPVAAQPAESTTQRLIGQPPLDSLDVPRPYWREKRTNRRPIETDPTERVDSDNRRSGSTEETVSLKGAVGEPPPPADPAHAPAAARPPEPDPPAEPPEHPHAPDATPALEAPQPAPVAAPEPPPAEPKVPAAPETAPQRRQAAPAPEVTPAFEPPHAEAPLEPEEPPERAGSRPGALVVEEESVPAEARGEAEAGAEADGDGDVGAGAGANQSAAPDPETDFGALADWQAALKTASSAGRFERAASSGPPPPPAPRRKPATIELMKSDEDAIVGEEPAPQQQEVAPAVARADSEDGTLSPGMMVLGPPPATHSLKSRSLRALARAQLHEDETVERRIDLPSEATRPSKRPTTQRSVVLPPEAFPEETSPSASSDGSEDDSSDPD